MHPNWIRNSFFSAKPPGGDTRPHTDMMLRGECSTSLPFSFQSPIPCDKSCILPKAARHSAPRVDAAATCSQQKRHKRHDYIASSAKQFIPIQLPSPRPRNGMVDLGYAVQKSRDTLECMNSSLEAQLTTDNYTQLGLKRAFAELGEAFAKDAKAMSSGSFDRGVSHGKWLAGVAPEKEEAMAQLSEALRIEHFRLQQQYKQLHVQSQTQIATIAHLEQIQLTHPQLPPVPVALSQESISRYQDDCDLTQMLEDIQPLGAEDGDFSGLLTEWAQGMVDDHRAAMTG